MLCECADALLLPGEQSLSSQMYDLLKQSLDMLDHGDDMTAVLALYLADVLRISGMAPDVDECTVCAKTDVSALSVQAGGASWDDVITLVDFLHQYGGITLRSFAFLQELYAH